MILKEKMTSLVSWFALALVALALPIQGYAGSESGGGGDGKTEMRINEIRMDLLRWIDADGGQGLTFPAGVNYERYRAAMKAYLQPHAVVVGSVTSREEKDTSNSELKVVVNGQPKTCRGFVSTVDHRPHILCNVERFAATSQSVQYQLIHHEYAGLAQVEKNQGPSSDYSISSQISEYLVPETVLRLAVKKPSLELCGSLPLTELAKNPTQLEITVGENWFAYPANNDIYVDRGGGIKSTVAPGCWAESSVGGENHMDAPETITSKTMKVARVELRNSEKTQDGINISIYMGPHGDETSEPVKNIVCDLDVDSRNGPLTVGALKEVLEASGAMKTNISRLTECRK